MGHFHTVVAVRNSLPPSHIENTQEELGEYRLAHADITDVADVVVLRRAKAVAPMPLENGRSNGRTRRACRAA